MTRWYYEIDDQEYGPISDRELLILVKQSDIFANTRIRKDEDGQWVYAASVVDFSKVEPAQPPIAQPSAPIRVNSTQIRYGLNRVDLKKSNNVNVYAETADMGQSMDNADPMLMAQGAALLAPHQADQTKSRNWRLWIIVLLVFAVLFLLLVLLVFQAFKKVGGGRVRFDGFSLGGNTQKPQMNGGAGPEKSSTGSKDSLPEKNADAGKGISEDSSANSQSATTDQTGVEGSVKTDEVRELEAPKQTAKVSMSIRLTWDSQNDLDLKVKCPDETEISYATQYNGGGSLEITGNNSQTKTNNPEELITWSDDAPIGTYRVVVTFDSAENVSDVQDYLLVVVSRNGAPKEFSGSISCGDEIEITNFQIK